MVLAQIFYYYCIVVKVKFVRTKRVNLSISLPFYLFQKMSKKNKSPKVETQSPKATSETVIQRHQTLQKILF
jgi:hypothetical protein